MNPTVSSTIANKDGATWQNTLSNGQVITSANPQSIYSVSPKNVNPASQYTMGAPTVISNQTKKDQVNDMSNQVNQLSQGRGMTSDGTTTKYSDGTIAQDNYQEPTLPSGATPIYGDVNGVGNRIIGYQGHGGTNADLNPVYFDSGSSTPEEKQYNDILNQMRSSTDATTAAAIASIQQKSALLKEQQKQINAGQEAGVRNALLMGGVTGQGSSSQYAPISSEGLVATQMSYGVQKLAELDSQENDLINQARAAGEAKNFQLLEKSLALVEKKREEKAAATKALNDKIAAQNAKAREKMIQSSRDNALADLYGQGITDPQEMLKALNENGGDFTIKEITDGLKDLVPPGLDDLVKTLRNNGAPQDVIQKVLSSGNMSEAYKNAGNYSAGGSGIIGEYNFYKSQAEARGQMPVDFNEYQTMDANRKAVIAKAGATQYGGLDSAQQKAIDQINTSVTNNAAYKKYSTMQTFINNVESALAQGSGIGDIAAINQFQKVIDEGAVTRDQDVKLLSSAQSLSSRLKTFQKKLEKGDQLAPEQRTQILDLSRKMLIAQKKALENDPGLAAQKKKAERYGVSVDETALGEVETTGQVAIQTEEQAKKTIDDSYKNLAPEVKTSVKDLFNQGYTNSQVVEYLKIRKAI